MPINNALRYQEIEIKSATPLELVVQLYDAALAGLQKAQEHMAAHDIAGRARSLNKVTAILTELQASLNFEAGGSISPSLDRLYRYMKEGILRATFDQDPAPLKENVKLLSGLRAAWAEVARAEARKKLDASAENGVTSAGAATTFAAGARASSAMASLNITG